MSATLQLRYAPLVETVCRCKPHQLSFKLRMRRSVRLSSEPLPRVRPPKVHRNEPFARKLAHFSEELLDVAESTRPAPHRGSLRRNSVSSGSDGIAAARAMCAPAAYRAVGKAGLGNNLSLRSGESLECGGWRLQLPQHNLQPSRGRPGSCFEMHTARTVATCLHTHGHLDRHGSTLPSVVLREWHYRRHRSRRLGIGDWCDPD